MRAIVATELGEPGVLRLADAPRPEPEPGQVLVRVHTAGVNFSDTEEGSLRLKVSAVLPLADAAEAHRLIESRQSVGKIVLDAG